MFDNCICRYTLGAGSITGTIQHAILPGSGFAIQVIIRFNCLGSGDYHDTGLPRTPGSKRHWPAAALRRIAVAFIADTADSLPHLSRFAAAHSRHYHNTCRCHFILPTFIITIRLFAAGFYYYLRRLLPADCRIGLHRYSADPGNFAVYCAAFHSAAGLPFCRHYFRPLPSLLQQHQFAAQRPRYQPRYHHSSASLCGFHVYCTTQIIGAPPAASDFQAIKFAIRFTA